MQKEVNDFKKRSVGELKLDFFGISGDVSGVNIKPVSLKKDKTIRSILTHLRNKLNKMEEVNIKEKDIIGRNSILQYVFNWLERASKN